VLPAVIFTSENKPWTGHLRQIIIRHWASRLDVKSIEGGSGSPRIGVVIINFNDAENSRRCLSSLRTLSYPNIEVYCVDNGSKDDSPRLLAEEFKEARFIMSKRNVGFAGGMNLGFRAAIVRGCEFILCFNSDAAVDDPELLQKLLAPFDADERMGVTSPVEYDITGTEARYPRCTSEARYEIDVTGAAFLVSAEVLRKVGLFDEGFFLYYEDSDLFARIRGSGYNLMTVPDSRFLHVGSSTTRTQSPMVMYLDTRNRMIWFARHWGVREFLEAVVKLHLKRMPRYVLMFCEQRRSAMLSAYLRGLLAGILLLPKARTPGGIPLFDAERWTNHPGKSRNSGI
jgi:GT2 family glycosyltransferase